MSEIADTPIPVPAAVPGAVTASDVHTVHEAYSFACMRCGYGWEQAYAIEHHVDGKGEPFIMYKVNGERVPSPCPTRPASTAADTSYGSCGPGRSPRCWA